MISNPELRQEQAQQMADKIDRSTMTDDVEAAAFELHQAAVKYREAYEKKCGPAPVVWVYSHGEEQMIYIADPFNAQTMARSIGMYVNTSEGEQDE